MIAYAATELYCRRLAAEQADHPIVAGPSDTPCLRRSIRTRFAEALGGLLDLAKGGRERPAAHRTVPHPTRSPNGCGRGDRPARHSL